MNWNNIKITIFKELRGIFRDRKSLQKLILYPLIIPTIILLFGLLFDTMDNSNYVIGTNYSLTSQEKDIIEDFDNITFQTYSSEKKLKEAYKEKKIEGYIIRQDNKYVIYTDETQNSGNIVLTMANLYLDSYSKILGSNYLEKQGIDSDLVFHSIIIEEKSLGKDDSDIFIKTIFSLIIAYVIMIVVMVCVVVVIDATSGEKERGTLETILTFPVKSSELVIGKYLATSILGFILGLVAYLLTIPAFYFGIHLFKSYEEVIFTVSVSSVFLVLFVILLTSFLAAGVCMALSGKAKSYKEAQSSLQFVSMLPIIPYFLNMMEVDVFILNLIPIANCSSLLNDIIINDINYQSLLTVIVSTIIYTICTLLYISRQYKKEETLFS